MSSIRPTLSADLPVIPEGGCKPLPEELSAVRTTTPGQVAALAFLVGLLAVASFAWGTARVWNGLNEGILAFYGLMLGHRGLALASGLLYSYRLARSPTTTSPKTTSPTTTSPTTTSPTTTSPKTTSPTARGRTRSRRARQALRRLRFRPGAIQAPLTSRAASHPSPSDAGSGSERLLTGSRPVISLGDPDPEDLPVISVLVPLYREASVVPQITGAIGRMKYPVERLEVLLLLEEEDRETRAACDAILLPPHIRVVVTPDGRPRTKPRACNYGLSVCRGEIVVIYDAEDQPEADQFLLAAEALTSGDPSLSCVQARLAYYNPRQNLLTRWFAAEYMAWFDLMLPGLHAIGAPIPLGGTSNHFRSSVLREVGGWDSWNVAEDCDLGIRLYRNGYHVQMLDSTTWEEACPEIGLWIRQRSRWVKGYLQTWLVHTRNPLRLWRDLGPWRFVNMQLLVGGSIFCLVVNPFYWLLTLLWWTHPTNWESALMGGPTLVLGNLSFIVGNTVFMACHAAGALRRRQWDLALLALLAPFYWVLMSIAAWKAILQIITAPHHWEKTSHGLARMPPAESLPEPGVVEGEV